MANNQIRFDVGFNVQQSELNKVKTALQELQNIGEKDLVETSRSKQNLESLKTTISTVQQALEEAYNPKLDSTNLEKFNSILSNSGLTIAQVQRNLQMAGEKGNIAFRDLTAQILTTNIQLKESIGFIDRMADTLTNTIRWNIASGALNKVTGSIQKAYSFTKKLDTSLNNIQIVTEKSSDEMANFAIQANKAAKALGSSTTDYTDASLIYYQQGLSDSEVKARTEVTLKVANITKQSADQVSEQLTAVWNGYKVTASEAELYIDKLSAVAASTASDLEELSSAMSKVASIASTMGVDIDQLNAQLSTIISATRQDANSVGNALKTIYARIGDLAVQGQDEFGVTLGDVSGKLKVMGVDILDQTGNMKDLGGVIEEVAGKWSTWTQAQQQAAAVALAGKRQYNNLIALFENWDKYESALTTSEMSEGTLQKQQDIYMNSLEAHLQQLSTTAEELYMNIFDSDSFKDFLDILTVVVDKMSMFIDAIGGGGNLLLGLGSTAVRVFSVQIADAISTAITNIKGYKHNIAQLEAEAFVTDQFKDADLSQKQIEQLVKIKEHELELGKAVNKEDREHINNIIKATNALFQQQDALEERANAARKTIEQQVGEKEDKDKPTIFDSKNSNDGKQSDRQVEVKEKLENVGKDYKNQADSIQRVRTEIKKLNTDFSDLYDTNYDLVVQNNDVLEQYEELTQSLNRYENKQEELNKKKEELNQLEEQLKTKKRESPAIVTDEILALEVSITKIKDEISSMDESGLEAAISTTSEDLKTLKKSIEETNKPLDAYIKELEKLQKSSIGLKNSIKSQIVQFNKTKKSLPTEQVKKATEAIHKYYDALKEYGPNDLNTIKAAEEAFEAMNSAMEEGISKNKEATQTLEDYNKSIKKIDESEKELENTQKNVFSKIELTKAISDVTSMVGAVGQLAFGIQSLKNIGSIWDDENVSVGDKILQTIMAVSSALTALTAIQKVWNGLKAISTLITTAHTASATANAAATTAEGVAAGGASVGFWSLAAAEWASVWPALLLLAAIGALITIIWGISEACKSYEASLHIARQEAEEANKNYEEQTKALQAAKQAYDDLKNSIEDYTTAQNAIDDMIAGTDEWKEAIIEANQQVMSLISTYAELADYVTTDSNGRMTISQEGLDKVTEISKKELNQANKKAMIAQVRRNEANMAASKEDIYNSTYKGRRSDEAALTWILAGPIAGAIYEGVNAAQSQGLKGQEYDKVMDLINEKGRGILNSEADFKKALSEANINLPEVLIDELMKNTSALANAAQEIKENTLINARLKDQIAASAMSGMESYENTELKDIAQRAISQNAEKGFQEELDELNRQADAAGNKQEDKDKYIAEQYAKMMGDGYSVKDGKVYNEEGDEVNVSIDEMKKSIAQNRAYDAAAAKADEEIKKLESKAAKIDQYGKGLGHLVLQAQYETTTDFSSITETLYNSLKENQDKLSKEEKKAAQKIIDQYNKEIENIKTQNAAAVRSAFESFDTSEVSLAGQKKIAKAFANAFKVGGSEAINKTSDFLAQYSGEELEKVTDIYNSIDWSQNDAGKNFYEAMSAAGIEIKNTGNVYNNLISNFEESRSIINDVTVNFEKLKTKLQEISSITKDINIGDIISEEDYQNLLKYGSEIADFFILTEEGYKAIASGDSIKEVANKGIRGLSAYKKALDDFKGEIDSLNKKELDYSTDNSSTVLNTLKELTSGSYENIIKASGYNKEALTEDYNILNYKKATDDNSKKELGKALGLSENEIASLTLNDINSRLETAQTKAAERSKEVIVAIQDILKNAENGIYELSDETQQILASQAKSYDELREMLNNGLSIDNYNKVRKSMIQEEVKELGLSIDSWEAWAKTVDEATEEAALANFKKAAALDDVDLTITSQREIDKLTRSLEKLQKQADKSIGQKAIDSLEEQQEKQQEIIAEQKKQISALEKAEIIRKKALDDATSQLALSLGVEKNKIKYYDIQLRYIQETNKEKKAELQKWLELYDAVEETSNSIEDAKVSLSDMGDELESMALEQWDLTIQLKIDTADAKRAFYDFMEEAYKGGIAEDNYLARANLNKQRLLTYYDYKNGGAGSLMDTVAAMKDAQNLLDAYKNKSLDKYISKGGKLTYTDADGKVQVINEAAAKERYDEYLEKAKDDASAILELYQTIKEEYISALENATDKFDKQNEVYSHIQSRISHDMNLIKLIYGEKAYKELDKYYDAQQSMYAQTLDMQKQSVDFWASTMASIEDKSSEEYQYAQEQWMAAIEERNSTTEEAISNLQEKYSNAINAIFTTFEEGLTKDQNLDYLTEQWGYITDQEGRYFDTINSEYQKNKLKKMFDDALDSLKDNVNAQKELNKIKQQELSILEKKGKLTQYDIDRSELQYQIAMKRIELENAQLTATKMKLVRDSNGNYSYQFVTDQDQTSKLQQELDDLQNSLYNLDKDEWKSKTDDILSIWQEFCEKMASTTDENMQELYMEQYFGSDGILTNLLGDMSSVTGNIENLFSALGKDVSIPGFNTFNEFFSKLTDPAKVEEMINSIKSVTNEYNSGVDNIETISGEDFDTLVSNATNAVELYQTTTSELLTQTNDQLIQNCKDQIDAIKEVLDELDDYKKGWQEVIDTIAEAEGAQLGINAQQVIVTAGTTSMDTGGYTGDWGKSGKLAILHEKELVLNKEDTANILNAVDIMRSIAGIALRRASGLLDNIDINSIKNSEVNNSNSNIQQHITIEANFPDAVNREEIQEAFNSLANLAIQKAGTNDKW